MKTPDEKDLHKGHRQRLRESFLRGGPEGMADHALLELLLTYALPRVDVNPLAHRLLRTFGSLAGVFQAGPEALKAVDGMGAGATVFLKVILACGHRILRQYYAGNRSVDMDKPMEACRFALAEAIEDRYETLRIICLDSKYHLIETKALNVGNTTSVTADPRHIIEAALVSKAHSIILSHNHPSGDIRPSQDDCIAAQKIREAAEGVGLQVVDQLILGHGAVYSFQRDRVFAFSSSYAAQNFSLEDYMAQQNMSYYDVPSWYEEE